MDPKHLLLGVVLIGSSAAAATTRPAEMGTPDPNESDLARQIRELVPTLPSLNHVVTDELQAKGAAACKVFRAAYPKREKMSELKKRMQLALVGLHGGFAAGDPNVMLPGAKLLLAEAGQTKLAGYAWFALAWSAIFKGEPKTAEAALKHLAEKGAGQGLDKWAGSMMEIAGQSGRRVHLTLGVVAGKRITTTGLLGQATVLEFGAGNIQPWVKALDILKQIHADRKDDARFTMLGVSREPTAAAAKATAEKHSIAWPLLASMTHRERFLGKGLPHVVVISPAGHVIWQGHPIARGNLVMTIDFARRQADRMAKLGPAPTASAPADDAETLARRKYRLARTYRDAGLADRARAVLTEIVRKYPQTAAAAEARTLLAEKPKP